MRLHRKNTPAVFPLNCASAIGTEYQVTPPSLVSSSAVSMTPQPFCGVNMWIESSGGPDEECGGGVTVAVGTVVAVAVGGTGVRVAVSVGGSGTGVGDRRQASVPSNRAIKRIMICRFMRASILLRTFENNSRFFISIQEFTG